MSLLKRIMWPRLGEQVAIYQRGELIVEGHVTYAGEDSITVLGREVTATVTTETLREGIDDGSIIVKKLAYATT